MNKKRKIVKNQTVKDLELSDAPAFYRSAGGNPYNTRMGDGIDVSNNMFKNVEVDEFTHTITTGSAIITRTHNLGYKPFVFGTYKMINATVIFGTNYPSTVRGTVPEDRAPLYGLNTGHVFYIGFVDESIYKLVYFIDANGGQIDFKINLLRETTADN